MLAAARQAADGRPGPPPILIAVTVLTSLDATALASTGVPDSPLDQVLRLARLAKSAGLDGVVASPLETAAIRAACGPEFVIVTPGLLKWTINAGRCRQRTLFAPAARIRYRPDYGRPDPRAAAAPILVGTADQHPHRAIGRYDEVSAAILRQHLRFLPAEGLILTAHDADARRGIPSVTRVTRRSRLSMPVVLFVPRIGALDRHLGGRPAFIQSESFAGRFGRPRSDLIVASKNTSSSSSRSGPGHPRRPSSVGGTNGGTHRRGGGGGKVAATGAGGDGGGAGIAAAWEPRSARQPSRRDSDRDRHRRRSSRRVRKIGSFWPVELEQRASTLLSIRPIRN